MISNQLELTSIKRDWVEQSIPRVEMFFDGKEFTSDDLHRILDAPDHANYFGVLIATMKKRGLIKEVGYEVSTQPERNKARVLKWRMGV